MYAADATVRRTQKCWKHLYNTPREESILGGSGELVKPCVSPDTRATLFFLEQELHVGKSLLGNREINLKAANKFAKCSWFILFSHQADDCKYRRSLVSAGRAGSYFKPPSKLKRGGMRLLSEITSPCGIRKRCNHLREGHSLRPSHGIETAAKERCNQQ